MGFGSFLKKAFNAPAKLVGETVYRSVKSVTGSEKFASATSRVMSVSTSALGGDPVPFRKTMTAEDVGANPTLFRTGRQAGDVFGVAVGTIFVGGALAGGGAAAGEGGGAGAVTAGEAGTASGFAEAGIGDYMVAEGVGEGAGLFTGGASGAEVATSGGFFSSVATGAKYVGNAIGATGLLQGIFSKVATAGEEKLSSYIDREVSSIFNSDHSTASSGGSGESGNVFSFLPYILIGLTLLGAFILTRKSRGKR